MWSLTLQIHFVGLQARSRVRTVSVKLACDGWLYTNDRSNHLPNFESTYPFHDIIWRCIKLFSTAPAKTCWVCLSESHWRLLMTCRVLEGVSHFTGVDFSLYPLKLTSEGQGIKMRNGIGLNYYYYNLYTIHMHGLIDYSQGCCQALG